MRMRRIDGTLVGWLACAGVAAAIGACGSSRNDAAAPLNVEVLSTQIQHELDAATAANPGPAQQARPVRPVLTCVDDLGDRQFRAHFGYDNGSASDLTINIGFFNRFWPLPINRGQPTKFVAGGNVDVVQVPFDASSAVAWVLGDHFAIAT